MFKIFYWNIVVQDKLENSLNRMFLIVGTPLNFLSLEA